jgi:hypothetical protein
VRDKILKRWVKQPPVGPNMQYLRDAERLAAWDQLGSREHVLDVASESNVTAGLDAERVTRLDFSADAIDHARDLLGETVDCYEHVDPGDPVLPFPDDHFDAAVSIGPYDWKFLDVAGLTAELHRVVTDLLVFSVPTPRSPYATRNHNRYRYFEPEAALKLVSPDWRVVDYDLLFQYPGLFHYLLNDLPEEAQEPFVDVAWWLSDLLTERGRWHDASYLVLGVEPMTFDDALDDALDCLFRPTTQNGFWDRRAERIVRELTYEVKGADALRGETPDPGAVSFDWTPGDEIQWRYASFAVMGAMTWRQSALGTDAYDPKLRAELDYFAARVDDEATLAEVPSYGVGPLVDAFARAGAVLDEAYRETAWTLYRHSRTAFDFSHAEDALLPFGWVTLLETAPADEATDDLLADVDDALWRVNDRVSGEGLFDFDNGTTRRHQNQMYSLWGLCRGIRATDRPGYLDTVERVLDYTVAERMRPDGAFVWEDVPAPKRARFELLKRLGKRPPHWDFLYECHQTFFVTAVAEYYAAGGERSYDREVRRAMAWVFGDNALGTDLTDLSGIGIPMRFLTTDRRVDVPDQQFKGAYEVGAWLLALTRLLDGPF